MRGNHATPALDALPAAACGNAANAALGVWGTPAAALCPRLPVIPGIGNRLCTRTRQASRHSEGQAAGKIALVN